jgi:hypothetical protein
MLFVQHNAKRLYKANCFGTMVNVYVRASYSVMCIIFSF